MNMKEVRAQARERMKGFCRVCPVCDGRACAGEIPGMGGVDSGSSFRNNVQALAAVRLNMRLVHDVTSPAMETRFLGLPLSLPVLAAPVGMLSSHVTTAITEEAYSGAIISGCQAAGTLGCIGDAPPPSVFQSGLAAIAAEKGYGIPVIKPWDGPELEEKLVRAAETDCPMIGMDIDAAGWVHMAKQGHPVSPKSPAQLKAFADRVHSLGKKCILKGVMGPEDAIAALHAGCDALVVSNHGGRVLDHTPGTAEVLPAVAAAVKGRMGILVDGGIRTGGDILKMLALGADAVLIGRPLILAAVGGLAEGVQIALKALRFQLLQAMILTGCASVEEAGPHLLVPTRR